MTKIYTKISREQILLLVSLVRISGGSSLVAGNKVVSFIPGFADKTETYGEILSLLEDSEDFYIRKANERDIAEYKYLKKMSSR